MPGHSRHWEGDAHVLVRVSAGHENVLCAPAFACAYSKGRCAAVTSSRPCLPMAFVGPEAGEHATAFLGFLQLTALFHHNCTHRRAARAAQRAIG